MTEVGSIVGTAQYLSPEQARGHSVGPQSDIYSMGVVLYEMLTGEVPFTGSSAVEIAMKQVNEAPQPPSTQEPADHPRPRAGGDAGAGQGPGPALPLGQGDGRRARAHAPGPGRLAGHRAGDGGDRRLRGRAGNERDGRPAARRAAAAAAGQAQRRPLAAGGAAAAGKRGGRLRRLPAAAGQRPGEGAGRARIHQAAGPDAADPGRVHDRRRTQGEQEGGQGPGDRHRSHARQRGRQGLEGDHHRVEGAEERDAAEPAREIGESGDPDDRRPGSACSHSDPDHVQAAGRPGRAHRPQGRA